MTVETKQQKRVDWILVVIAVLAAFLNYFNIWNQNSDNAYYTSAVTSMLQSFHNFFYASFDSGGFVTVDKPPVVFWIQTAFAAVFGVHSWSVILPQAMADVGSVLLLYFLVKPTFGKTAARFASLIMACTPIAVAVSRTNNIDGMLVFVLLLAAWMLGKGIRTTKIGWILGAFAMIGVGFNMKMLQAYMVVPAFYLLYLIAFKASWKKKWTVLAASTAIMVVISLSWAVIVDSIPAKDRPYEGSSQTNSVLELAFGYNGVSRLTGNQMRGEGQHSQENITESGSKQTSSNTTGSSNNTNQNQQQNQAPDGMNGQGEMSGGERGGPGGQGGGGMFNTGQAGPLRLFQQELSGQISWLLPFVIITCIGLLAGIRRKQKWTDKQKETLFWLGWLVPGMVFFSIAGFFHQYYLIMLAPPIAAIAGAGWAELWSQYRSKEGWKTWLLPIGILVTTAFQLYILSDYQQQIGIGWSIAVGVGGIGLSFVLFFVKNQPRVAKVSSITGLLLLLVAPLYWASTGVISGVNSVMPSAGPSSNEGFGGMARMNVSSNGGQGFPNMESPNGNQGMPNMNGSNSGQGFPNATGSSDQGFPRINGARGGMGTEQINEKLYAYVTKHNTGEKFIFATTSSQGAAPYIIKTGKAVMAMGGFSGSDPILTVAKLQEMVKNKEVKFFLIPSESGFGFGGGESSSVVMDWIRTHGTKIPSSQWKSTSDQGSSMGQMGSEELYEINS